MKHIKLLLILVLTTASSFAFSQWTENNTQTQINEFSFVDDNIGYRINGTQIYKTSDGGNSWTTIQGPLFPGNLWGFNIDFTADGIGFVTAFGTLQNTFINHSCIYKTIDDGATWSDITTSAINSNFINYPGFATEFINSDVGFYALSNVLYRTNNGGATWDTTNLSFNIRSMSFFNENNGIISLEDNFSFMPTIQLLTTIDGGVTWENVNIPGQNSWFPSSKLVQVSPSIAYATSWSINSTDQIIFRIANNGFSVDTISLPNGQELQDFDFFDELNGFIVLKNHNNDNCYLYSTNDGGDNWVVNDSVNSINGSTIYIQDLHLTNTTGYLSVSNYGNNIFLESFYKFEGGVGIPEIETRNSTIYPNPAVSGQTISWDSDRLINEVNIIDLNGKLISKRSINENSMELPSLNTGMYFVQLMSNRSSETISLIIK